MLAVALTCLLGPEYFRLTICFRSSHTQQYFCVKCSHSTTSPLLFITQVVVVMQGRFHFYQGFSMYQVTLPVRIMKQMGVSKMVVTNAAGGLKQDWKV